MLALSVLPGVISRAFLLVARPDQVTGSAAEDGREPADRLAPEPGEARSSTVDKGPRPDAAVDEVPKGVAELAALARAERYLFDPPPGTLAARLLAWERRHPRLYASRHVTLAVGKVALGLLGVALFFQLILRRVVGWIAERLPHLDWPAVPWPDVHLPSIPWPHLDWPDLPDLTLPGWLLAVVVTAKYWMPVLVAIGLAVAEVRRRTGQRPDAAGRRPGAPRRDHAGPADPSPNDPGKGSPRDAHR